MQIEFTKRFLKDTKHLRGELRKELEKAVNEIIEKPSIGKPLRYSFKNCRSVRVSKFRIIYNFEVGRTIFITFEHRKKVYKT